MKNKSFLLVLLMLLLAALAGAQERMNVLLADKSVQSFDVPEVEQVSFDSKGSVALQVVGADGVTATAAALSAKLAADVPALSGVACGFFYGTSVNPQQQVQAAEMSEDGIFHVSLSGLTAATTYYFRPYAVVDGMFYYGDTSFFRTREAQVGTEGVAFLSPYASAEDIVQNGDDDEASAWLWFHQEYPECPFLYAGNIHSQEDLAPYKVLFYIRDLDSGSEDNAWTQPSSIQQATPYIREWYRSGGNLLLWQHAVTFIADLGRMDRDMMRACDHRITIGNGSWNQGQWYVAAQLNPGSRFVKDFSQHPLYRGCEVRSAGRSKYITVKGPACYHVHARLPRNHL